MKLEIGGGGGGGEGLHCIPGQCKSKDLDGGAGRGWLCMCSLMMYLIFCQCIIPSYNNIINWQK